LFEVPGEVAGEVVGNTPGLGEAHVLGLGDAEPPGDIVVGNSDGGVGDGTIGDAEPSDVEQ